MRFLGYVLLAIAVILSIAIQIRGYPYNEMYALINGGYLSVLMIISMIAGVICIYLGR